MRLGVTAKVGQILMWSNNVESCKKFNEKAQTSNFSVLAKGRQLHKELLAENMKN